MNPMLQMLPGNALWDTYYPPPPPTESDWGHGSDSLPNDETTVEAVRP